MCNFHVGQKVVCIDAKNVTRPGHPSKQLVEGKVYEIALFKVHEETGVLYLRTTEVDNGFVKASRFRPVIDRKSDISIFTDMLKTTRVEERA